MASYGGSGTRTLDQRLNLLLLLSQAKVEMTLL